MGSYHAQHFYLAGRQVYLDLGGLGAKAIGKVDIPRLAQGDGGWRLVFVKGLQDVSLPTRQGCHFADGHRSPIGTDHPVILESETVWRGVQFLGDDICHFPAQLLGGQAHGVTGDVGLPRGSGRPAVGRLVGVT